MQNFDQSFLLTFAFKLLIFFRYGMNHQNLQLLWLFGKNATNIGEKLWFETYRLNSISLTSDTRNDKIKRILHWEKKSLVGQE